MNQNPLSVTRSYFEFTVYFANSLWFHSFSWIHHESIIFFAISSIVFRIHHELTIFFANILWIHYQFTICFADSLWFHFLLSNCMHRLLPFRLWQDESFNRISKVLNKNHNVIVEVTNIQWVIDYQSWFENISLLQQKFFGSLNMI